MKMEVYIERDGASGNQTGLIKTTTILVQMSCDVCGWKLDVYSGCGGGGQLWMP